MIKNEHCDVHEIPCDKLDQLLAMYVLSVRKNNGASSLVAWTENQQTKLWTQNN